MKKIILAGILTLLYMILVTLVAYLVVAFVRAEINPLDWSMDGRFIMVFIAFGGCVFAPIIFNELKDLE